MAWRVGDRARLCETGVVGTVRAVNQDGHVGVDWDDGDVTPDGMLHRDDVHRVVEPSKRGEQQ